MPESVPVSVVVPCWRCRDTIARTVESIAAQTELPHEVILIDDASGDGTAAVLHALAGRYPKDWIKVIEQGENGGAGVARNAGWEAAKSPYIAFLDADDAWHPRKLEIQVAWMEAHPEVAMTATQTSVLGRAQDVPVHLPSLIVRKLSFYRMLLVNSMPTRSVVVRSKVQNRFLPGKRYSEDYLLWLSVIADGHQAVLLEIPLAYSFKRDFGAGGLSAHLWRFHCEVLDTYKRLYRAGHITGLTCKFLEGVSFLKLFRRWLQSTLT